MKTKKIVLSLALIFSIFAACSDSGTVKDDPCAGADAQNNPDCNIAPLCGDGVCADSESNETCPQDCEKIEPAACGNKVCESGETISSCPEDCKTTDPEKPVCGNGLCEANEAASNCPDDCSNPSVCGDAKCEQAENYGNCPADCEKTAICGDGTCDTNETNASCAADCPKFPTNFIDTVKTRISDFLTVDKTPVVEQMTRKKVKLPCLITENKWTETPVEGNSSAKINDLEMFGGQLYIARDDGLFVQHAPTETGVCSPLKKVTGSPADPITALAVTRRNPPNEEYLYVGVSPTNTQNTRVIRLNEDWTWHTDVKNLTDFGVNKVTHLAVLASTPYVAKDQMLLKGTYNETNLSWQNIAELASDQYFVAIKSTYAAKESNGAISYSPRNLYTLTNVGSFNSLNLSSGAVVNFSEQLGIHALGSVDIDDIAGVEENENAFVNMMLAANNGIYLLRDKLELLSQPNGNFKKLFVDAADKLAFALTKDDKIYVSKDFGVTWSKIDRADTPVGIGIIHYNSGLLFGATSGENGKVFVTKIH